MRRTREMLSRHAMRHRRRFPWATQSTEDDKNATVLSNSKWETIKRGKLENFHHHRDMINNPETEEEEENPSSVHSSLTQSNAIPVTTISTIPHTLVYAQETEV